MSNIKLYRPVAWEYEVSSSYGERIHPVTGEKGKMHYGVDLATTTGAPVVASVTGPIVLAGWEDPENKFKGFGLRIWQKDVLRDLFVCYAHLSELCVESGQDIVAGTRIALTGNTGASSGPHLHQECRIGGIAGKKGEPFEYFTGLDA